MISTSVFTTAALVLASNLFTLQANAIVLPRIDDGDFTIDIVEMITCTPLDGYTGTLIVKGTENAATNGDAALPDSGVSLGLVTDTRQENSEGQLFQFQNCTSSFMDLAPSDGVFYGHIVPVADASSCLSVYPSQPTPQPIVSEKCSMSDDSGQMLLFWKLTANAADASGPATIDFVGRSTHLGPDGIYVTDFTGADGSRAALIEHTDDHSKTSSYQIDLVPSAAPATPA